MLDPHSDHDPLLVHTRRRGKCIVVRPEGELDLFTVPALFAVLAQAETERRPIVVDLSTLTFLDSSGLGVLAAAHRRTRHHCGLRLAAVPGFIQRRLAYTGLDHVFALYPTLEQALRADHDR